MRTSLVRISVCALAILALAFVSAGCGGKKNRCVKAVDHAFEISKAGLVPMEQLSGKLADDVRKKIEERFAQERDNAVKRCQEELEKDPERVGKAIDCVLAADGIADLGRCGASFVGVK